MAPERGRQRARKFFAARRPIASNVLNHGARSYSGLEEYPNVPPRIGYLISRNPALAVPLMTTLGLEDLYDLVEIATVDAYNDAVLEKLAKET